MAELFNDTFASGVSGWTVNSGTFAQSASEGSDFSTGYGVLSGNSTITRTFTPVSSGLLRADFWWWYTSATTVAGAANNVFLYLLPDGTTTSTNSGAVVFICNDTGQAPAPNASEYLLQYRNNTAFQSSIVLWRLSWTKISIILNITARTYDIYIDDVLYHRSIPSPNAAFTSIDRMVVLSSAGAGDTYLDNVRVESNWTLSESVLIDHTFVGGTGEIEDSTPSTDARSLAPQKWSVPTAAGSGGFALGANGGTPDASAGCIALTRCCVDGILECEFKTSVAGTIWFGVTCRFWDFPSATGAGAVVLRWSGGAVNTIELKMPDRPGVLQTVQTVSATPLANTIYTLKIELRGRYLLCSTKQNDMDSGTYTPRWTHQASSSATGGRGMLSEEYAGPYVDTSAGAATDNVVRRFRFTGSLPPTDVNPTIGEYQYNVGAGSIRHLANSFSGAGTQNIFTSKGIQYAHRSAADGNFAVRQRTLFDLTTCKVYEQRVTNMSEYQKMSDARPFITLLRRGPWIGDHMHTFGVISYAEYWTPDWDLLPRYMASAYRYILASGASVNGTNTGAHDWVIETTVPLPVGYQVVTAFGSGDQIRITQVIDAASTNTEAIAGELVTKWEATGDPKSYAWGVPPTNMAANTDYTCGRGYLVQRGSGLTIDAPTLVSWRDDLKTPATLSVGTLKTDAAGDYNADGFNERHGWYEVTSASTFTVNIGGITRIQPAFRIQSLAGSGAAVSFNGTAGAAGTDYVIENMGDGNSLLQVLTSLSSNTAIAISGGGSGSGLCHLPEMSVRLDRSNAPAILTRATVLSTYPELNADCPYPY